VQEQESWLVVGSPASCHSRSWIDRAVASRCRGLALAVHPRSINRLSIASLRNVACGNVPNVVVRNPSNHIAPEQRR
jgi:hypothetical protein